MPHVSFTQNVQRHVACTPVDVPAGSMRQVLDAAFAIHPAAKGYFLDERGHLRTHVVVYLNGEAIQDRTGLSEAVGEHDKVYVMQALSGG
jgi:molybdopterin synthase sulfur carrier subunit